MTHYADFGILKYINASSYLPATWAATTQGIIIYILNNEKQLINTGGKNVYFREAAEKRRRFSPEYQQQIIKKWPSLFT